MRRLFALMGLSVTLAAPLHASPVDIGGGVEHFVWQEYDPAGGKLLKESGQRLFVSLGADNEVSDRWIYGFRGRLYSGTVNCNGQLKTGTTCTQDTDYEGISATADFTGRFIGTDGRYSDLALRLGLGGEGWRRRVQGAGSFTEEYTVLFGKLGFAYIPEQGLFGEAGVKYPLSVHEDVKLYDSVSLSPQGAFSPFATVGYNFNQRWSIRGYYDGYRFKSSDPKPLYDGGVFVRDVSQPKTNMDTFGITVGFYF